MGPVTLAPGDVRKSVSGKTLAIVGGGIEAVPGLRRAQEMGATVIVSDADASCPGASVADYFVQASTYDSPATIAGLKALRRRLDGVMCIGTDVPMTVAFVAHEFGLPGISRESALAASDKHEMKVRFAAGGVPVPWFQRIESVEELDALRASADWALVVKPVDSRGARGVLQLLDDVDTAWAFVEAHRHSPTGRVMVEQFLEGPQISTESVVMDGDVVTVGLADRNYEHLDRFAPYIVEDGGELPADIGADTRQAINDLVKGAAGALGIETGIIKGDVVLHEGVPHIIEVAARLSGGYFCTHEIPLSTGIDLVGAAILLALGARPDPGALVPTREVHVAQRYLFPKPGRVVLVEGEDEVNGLPGIQLCDVRVRPGDIVQQTDSHPSRAGVVITTGQSRREARERAIEAVRSIKITTVAL